MVAQFVRLKLTLLANAFRRSVWQTVGFVVGSLYGLFVVGLVVVGAVALGTQDAALVGTVVTLGGALVVLAWWIGPLFAFGVDATLDPQRFVTYAIPRRSLIAGLAAAGVVSIPGFVTLLAALGVSFAWWREPLALVAALVGALLAVAVCVVGSRATTTALSPLLESRRYREVVTIAAFVPLILVGPAISWFSRRMAEQGVSDGDALRTAVEQVARVVAWTPFGAPWALPAAVADGAWGLALARLLVALATLAVLAVVWDRALARALVSPRTGGGSGARAKGLGWFSRFPATPTGAVAARCATYWVRDPRYAGSLAVVPLVPVVLLVVGGGSGSEVFLVLAPVTAWLLGFGLSNDIAYDSTAFALHAATGVDGRADRWGRVLPVAVVGTPVVTLFAVVSVAVAGRWDALPAVLGVTLGTLAVALGVSSAVSARLLYPVPQPGESPFKSPQGAAMATMVAQLLAMAVVFAVSLPVLALALPAILLPQAALGWAALVVGPAVGVVVLVLGVRWGARTYDRRTPELLQQVLSFA